MKHFFTRTKRFGAILLAAVMLFSIIPGASAFASDGSPQILSDADDLQQGSFDEYVAEHADEFSQELKSDAIGTAVLATTESILAAPSSVASASTEDLDLSDFADGSLLYPESAPQRYTVLVLDTSGSMIGTPFNKVKETAQIFTKSLTEASSENYIALVGFSTSASVKAQFTNDAGLLADAISKLSAVGSTNQQDALVKADSLLDSVSEKNVVKNIVLLTDGLPEAGSWLLSGKYSIFDYGLGYGYANAAYKKAMEIRDDGTFIYSLAFFHSLSGTRLTFGRRFLKDLQNAGYYEVTKPEDLGSRLDEIAGQIKGPGEGSGEEPGKLPDTVKKGTFKYVGVFPEGTAAEDRYDFSAEYYYSDDYFLSDAKVYNPHLSTMSLCLTMAAISSYEVDPQKSGWSAEIAMQNVRELLTGDDGIGYQGFEYNHFWNEPPTINSIGAVAAHKKIVDPGSGEYTQIALAIRGGRYYSEWASNFIVGASGAHQGYSEAKENVLQFLSTYITDKRITGNIKLWIVGYSRAGTTANLVAGALNDGRTLPNVRLAQKDLFAYTYEAPQAAMIEQTTGDHRNIHNIINLNDIVPLFTQSAWGFARYNGSSHILPSSATASFPAKKAAMLAEFDKLEKTETYGYTVDEYTRSISVQLNWLKILVGGDAFVKLVVTSDRDYPQSMLLADTVANISKPSILSREKYVSDVQPGLTDIFERDSSYSGEGRDWLNQVLSKFTSADIEYIIAPIYSIKLFYSSSARIKDIAKRLTATFAKYSQETGIRISQAFIETLARVLADFIFSHPLTFVKLADNVMRGSVFQSHYAEITFAWLRSQDDYYTVGASAESSSGTFRVIRIDSAADANVYDSNHSLVASIAGDVSQAVDGGVVATRNEAGENLIYLPADESYTVNITAAETTAAGTDNGTGADGETGTDTGTITYSVNEVNLVTGEVARLVNYYDVPLTSGAELTGIVPSLSEAGSEGAVSNEPAAEYRLVDSVQNEVLASEDVKGGAAVEELYFNVVLKPDNDNGNGFVQGAGRFLKGSYAKVEATSQSGSVLLGWYKGDELVSTDSEYRFAVMNDTELTAKFSEVKRHNLKLAAAVGGKVTSAEGAYSAGTEIAVVAETEPGYEFVGWTSGSGGAFDDAAKPDVWFTMPDNDVTVTANFRALTNVGGKTDENTGVGGENTTDTGSGKTDENNTGDKTDNTGDKTDNTGSTNTGVSGGSGSGGGGNSGGGPGVVFTLKPTPSPSPEAASKQTAAPVSSVALSQTTAAAVTSSSVGDQVITKAPAVDSGFTAALTRSKTYTDGIFSDVASDAWYAAAVQFVYEYGIMNGTAPTLFSPDGNTSRAQIITILAR
ncbi:MAG: VWA domain-containing protein, partial [Clostridiales bacterium]|nr:VWA domain-containing protein [Clostridiales bacterium]